ncbi:MAG: hypothetical protein KAS96_03685, partial [Planctomycetes bacterium]|nr:hypothetical protein [Planctomycetota bacterium]
MMYKKILFLALVTFFLAGIASAADPNLVGWYKFDEGTGTLAADSSDYGNNATVNSSIGWDTGGYSGGCLNFDGTFTVDVPAAGFADVNEQVTISIWVNGDIAHEELGQVPFHGSAPLRGRALHAEIPGGGWSIYFAGGATTPDLNGDYDQSSWDTPPVEAYKGSWNNFTFVKNNIADVNEPTWMIYWNGLRKATRNDLTAQMDGIDTFVIGSRIDLGWQYYGKLDEFKIFDKALSRQEIADMLGVDLTKATSPSPLDTEEGVSANVILSWDAGLQAASHDVYLGTDETAVTIATNASAEFMGNFADAEYDDPCALDPNTLYYWRVDEINDVDLWTGNVWSFKVIPPLPPIPDPVLWLKMDEPNSENARLVEDHSGFGNDGTMGSADVWTEIPGLSGAVEFDGGSWGASGIVFDGDGNSLVADMGLTDKVSISLVISGHTFGDKGYAFSGLDSASAHVMSMEAPTGDTRHFLTKMGGVASAVWIWEAFNPASSNYIFAEADARRITVTVDLDPDENQLIYYLDDQVWTSRTFSGGTFSDLTDFTVGRQLWAEFDGIMSDFRIYDEILRPEHVTEIVGDYPKLAKKPSPAHESTDNYLNVTLSWNPGTDANSHQVYFGTDESAVAGADTGSPVYAGEVSVSSYDPNGLELMKTYYWRVDEVDAEGGTMEGPVWQFDTINYVMVEDFESYDEEGNDVTAVWADKLALGDMQRLLMNDPCLSPINSMRLRYQIPYPPYWAITNRSFSPAQDWTVNKVKILTINYYGDAANFGLPLFVTIG